MPVRFSAFGDGDSQDAYFSQFETVHPSSPPSSHPSSPQPAPVRDELERMMQDMYDHLLWARKPNDFEMQELESRGWPLGET